MMTKILPLLLMISCSEVHELHKKNGVHFLEDIKPEIQTLKNIEWKIGQEKEVTISKGLRLTSSIPKISENGKKVLHKKYGIDSWLIQVSRVKKGQKSALGYFYIKLENMTRTTKDFTVNLYYHAASVSKRFRMFHCPAFDHRKLLDSYAIKSGSPQRHNSIFIRPIRRLNAKATALQFSPIVVSGGKSLLGKYIIDLALYNSRNKQIYSNWFPSKGIIDVSSEITKVVKSCLGIKEENKPLPKSKMPSIRDLEIR